MPGAENPLTACATRVKQDHNLSETITSGPVRKMSKISNLPVQKRNGQAATSTGSGASTPNSSSASKNVSHVPCKFFKQGMCQAGEKCPFSHVPVEGKSKAACSYFLKGNCKFGAKCALAHITADGRKVSKKQARLAQAAAATAPAARTAQSSPSRAKDPKSKPSVPPSGLYTLAAAAPTHSADVIFAPAVPAKPVSCSPCAEPATSAKSPALYPGQVASASPPSNSLTSPHSSFSSPRMDFASIVQPSSGKTALHGSHGSFTAFSSPATQFQPLTMQSPASNARSLSFGYLTQRTEYTPLSRASSFHNSGKESALFPIQRSTNISQHVSSLWNEPPSSVGLQMFAFEEGSAIIDDDDNSIELGFEESQVPSFLNDEPPLESTYSSSYYRTDRSSVSDSDFSPPRRTAMPPSMGTSSWQKNVGGLWAPRPAKPPMQLPPLYGRPHDSNHALASRSYSATLIRPLASDFAPELSLGAENWNQPVHEPVRP